jgi:hypothetical protein
MVRRAEANNGNKREQQAVIAQTGGQPRSPVVVMGVTAAASDARNHGHGGLPELSVTIGKHSGCY